MDSRDEQALLAAKLYYESDFSQAEVAAEIGVSRPTAAKLLQHAREKGYVTIEVHDPREKGGELSSLLVDRFGEYGLRTAYVVQVARPGEDQLLKELGGKGARVLESLVQDGSMVGVSWGNTMYAVARALMPSPHRGVEIVQLKGGLGHTESSTNDIETINLFCRAFDAYARTLPLPVIFDSVEAKRIVEKDRHIAHLLELGRMTDIVVFTVGAVTRGSLPLTMGYLSEEEIDELVARAVGDACSRFYTAEGETALPSVDERTVGIGLADLAQRPVRLLVAGGTQKTAAIGAALRMGLATHLVIDAATAAAVLEA